MTPQNNPKEKWLDYAAASWKRSPRLALMIGAGLAISGCAAVQTPDEAADAGLYSRLAQKIDERDRKIAERDKAIDDLQRRVRQLESNVLASSQPSRSIATAKTNAPEKIAAAAPSAANQPSMPQKTASPQQVKAAPGSFVVDEDAAQRALERTLVQTGALLLPFGQAEIQPFVNYIRREPKQSFLFASNNNLQVANQTIRQNEFDMGANLLVGLPFESQAEFRIPYQVVNQSKATSAVGYNPQETNNTGNSIGDINVGLAKTVLHESEWIPDLVARLTWNAPSGDTTRNNVFLGGGFNAFTASMTALKRQDPLAFTATVAYQNTLKKNGIEPGDRISLAIGATLAASPQTSLSIGLQQTYALETRINNINVQGSDTVASAFTVGASSTIGRHLFFSALGGVGLTDSSPAYFFNITVPFRFDVPYKSLANKF